MAETKRYYWIKLKTDFFDQDKIDFLMGQENGAEYVVIYQMLMLKTAQQNGLLATQTAELMIPYDIKKIVRDTKYFDFDTVTVALELFKKLGLVYEEQNHVLKLANADELVGSETKWAEKKRIYRDNQKTLLGQPEDNVRQEIDIDKELDKDIDKDIEKDIKKDKKIKKKYGTYKHVLLTDEEHDKLNTEYTNADEIIEYLDSYIEEKGYKANSHYLSIKRWVVDALKEKKQRKECLNGKPYYSKHVKPLPDYMNEKGEANIPKEEYTAEEREKDQKEIEEELRKIREENSW